MYAFLKRIPLFADLPGEDLERLCQVVEEVRLEAGEELFREGSPGDRAYIIQEGELEIIKTSGDRPVLLAVRASGEVIGEMALLEEAPRMASVRARTACILLAIHQDHLDHLLDTSPSASRAMLHTVLARWRGVTAMLRQSEKMAQLGTLTAGIAHELNNPAAAVKRGASQLQESIEKLAQAQVALSKLGLDSTHQAAIEELAQAARHAAERPPQLDALARSDREVELEEWLEAQGIANAWELAPALVNLDYDPGQLASLSDQFAPHQLSAVVDWLSTTYSVHNLLLMVNQGATRISNIVRALKSYAYLDQAPVQSVDIHEGLDNTLLILRTKLMDGITVRREYAPDLPKIQGYGSELNQAWTNLVDNAADAVNGQGEITLRTRREGEWVIVEVADDGPGIPPDIQSRVFDAFFTTKPPGKGTGMGLDITYNIIANKHHGDIRIFSHPGQTCFQVWLPIDFEKVKSGAPIGMSIPGSSDGQMRSLLEKTKNIAVVFVSQRPHRPAYKVPAYLQEHGYRILPVSTRSDLWLDEATFPNLLAIEEPIDVVQLFLRSEQVPPVVRQAIQVGAKVIWMQLGVINEQAAGEARAAGLTVVMDQCMMATHKRLFAGKPSRKS